MAPKYGFVDNVSRRSGVAYDRVERALFHAADHNLDTLARELDSNEDAAAVWMAVVRCLDHGDGSSIKPIAEVKRWLSERQGGDLPILWKQAKAIEPSHELEAHSFLSQLMTLAGHGQRVLAIAVAQRIGVSETDVRLTILREQDEGRWPDALMVATDWGTHEPALTFTDALRIVRRYANHSAKAKSIVDAFDALVGLVAASKEAR